MRKVTLLQGHFARFLYPQPCKERYSAMTMEKLLDTLAEGPVIASVKDEAGLCAALESDAPVVFLLYGNVLNLGERVSRLHDAGKTVFVHLDLVDGLASREISADFVAKYTAADGVLSTKASLTRRAKELGLITIQRFFLLDSMALAAIEKHPSPDCSDIIEVLPGLMPKVIRRICGITTKPVIAGGLISDKEDVTNALAAGAVAVSATDPEVWRM